MKAPGMRLGPFGLCMVAVIVSFWVRDTGAFLLRPIPTHPLPPFHTTPACDRLSTHRSASLPCPSRAHCPAAAFPRFGPRPRTRLFAFPSLVIQPTAFKTSVNAVLRLVASCGLGLGAASHGLLDQASLSTLSRLIFAFFQPALLFTNVATTLATPSSYGSSLLVLPAFAVLQILFGFLYGKGMAASLRLDPASDAGKELAVCSAFANSGPLPLLFADAFFRLHPTDPTLYPRAVAYISFYLVAWSPLFWTLGSTILGSSTSQPAYAKSPPSPSPSPTLPSRLLHHPLLRKTLSPPTLGCLLGALVGSTPFLRAFFFGPTAPLAALFDALRTMGSAYLPTVLLVLAGSLAQGFKSLNLKDPALLSRTGAICFARFFLMPATAFLLLTLGRAFSLIPSSDPLLAFVLLLQACMPCAQNTVVILQLQQRPAAAASMATLVSLVYLAAIVPMGLLLSLIMQYVGM